MKTFKAAIFDLDGTIVNSNNVWDKIDRQILDKYGINLTEEEINELVTLNYADLFVKLHNFGVTDSDDCLMEQLNELAVYEYRNSVFLKPNVREYIQRLKAQGMKIGLATGSPKILYEPVLRHNNIYGLFDALCSIDEVARGKDFPDIYLLCASRLEVAPEDCIVFEDVLQGLVSAKSVGMYTVGVYDSYSADQTFTIKSVCDKYIVDFFDYLS